MEFQEPSMKLMKIYHLAYDKNTESPVIILKENEGKKLLPIWIGESEANAIASVLDKNFKFQRPLTHDLMKNLISMFKAECTKVIIHDLKDNTFYAKIFFKRNDDIISIDARPSDSIALALRTNSPIYVDDKILELEENVFESTSMDPDQTLKDFISKLKPEDFGKFEI
jgi:bifunctional DNase/RNase